MVGFSYRSIMGRFLGYNYQDKRLAAEGLEVFDGSKINTRLALPGPNDVVLFDDFTNNSLAQYTFTEGTDAATSVAAVVGATNGVLRLTTGDAGTGYAADAEQMTGPLNYKAANGSLVFEARIALSAITTCQVFVGFTDDATTLEIPIDSAGSANTITTTASNAVGFFFDTDMTDDTWWCAGVKADTDATHFNTGFAPVASTFETLRVEVDTSGNAAFFRNGAPVGTGRMSNAVTASTLLCPVITVSKLSVAASMTLDVDYVYAAQKRA